MMNGLKPGDLEKMISVARETYSTYGIQEIWAVTDEHSYEYGKVLVLLDAVENTRDQFTLMLYPKLEALGIPDYVLAYTSRSAFTKFKDMLDEGGGVVRVC